MKVFAKSLIFTAALAGVAGIAGAQMNPREKMAAALKAIQENYVDSMSDERLTDAAIKGMIEVLDPHSRYFSREEGEQMNQMMSGSFTGIGIQYVMQNDSVYVTQVIEEGPAAGKGLLAGDRILSVDRASVTGKGFSNFEMMKKLRGEKGSTVSLQIWRRSVAAPFTIEITRGAIPDHSVKAAYMLDKQTGYIALRIFNLTTRKEVDEALTKLKLAGMKNLVLDLQGNGGGYVEAAIGVADEFLKKDQLVFYSMPQDRGKDYYYAGGFGQFNEGRLVVMIDQNTASASEILSGALQDWDRAVLVGRRSFGKGLMQKPVTLADGSILELTGARYYTPSGRSIQKPYHGAKYEENIATRFTSGELQNAAFIHFPDSLKYTTKVNKRIVYGGGGIMPDVYVPVDTLEYNEWMQEALNNGFINQVVFQYLDSSRATVLQQWPAFEKYATGFTVPEQLVTRVLANARQMQLAAPATNEIALHNMLALEIKAQLAAQLYGSNQYYLRIANTSNKSLQQAMELLSGTGRYAAILAPSPTVTKGK
ncbi:carboxyl-terminal processing protease [Filimonas lacunae]|uniref:Carboxyl-terminal processing protease n=1 Tax=Filimonas lacunae TaxID=477680 RepID=A0A173MAW0_9BACT|nr:S41 family peptidase [Filimonas lacunae]BAV04694.1 carboxy-terminal processing protease [Filimonas lacunae]SIT32364.1 carboxyl-terminal processing protease [Filimonas lacunae]